MINYILDSLNPISHQQLKIKIKEMIGHSRQNFCILHVFYQEKKSIESMPILNDNKLLKMTYTNVPINYEFFHLWNFQTFS